MRFVSAAYGAGCADSSGIAAQQSRGTPSIRPPLSSSSHPCMAGQGMPCPRSRPRPSLRPGSCDRCPSGYRARGAGHAQRSFHRSEVGCRSLCSRCQSPGGRPTVDRGCVAGADPASRWIGRPGDRCHDIQLASRPLWHGRCAESPGRIRMASRGRRRLRRAMPESDVGRIGGCAPPGRAWPACHTARFRRGGRRACRSAPHGLCAPAPALRLPGRQPRCIRAGHG